MELLHLVRFLFSLDDRSLWALQRWVPDYQQILSPAKQVFQIREIEIGPWNRYVRSYVVPTLLIIPALAIIFVADSLAVTVCSTLVWLLVAGGLAHACRGG